MSGVMQVFYCDLLHHAGIMSYSPQKLDTMLPYLNQLYHEQTITRHENMFALIGLLLLLLPNVESKSKYRHSEPVVCDRETNDYYWW